MWEGGWKVGESRLALVAFMGRGIREGLDGEYTGCWGIGSD